MDNLSFHCIFIEIKTELEGRRLSSVDEAEEETYLLYFDGADRKRLLISVKPGHPRIHLGWKFKGSGTKGKSQFEAILSGSLEGLFLQMAEKDMEDRLIRLSFSSHSGKQSPEFFLLLELIGRSSNLVLTDRKDKVLGFARKLKSEFRQPALGAEYQRPLKPELSLSSVIGNETLDAEVSMSDEKREQFFHATMKGAPACMIRELVQRTSGKRSAGHVIKEIIEKYQQHKGEAYVYAPALLDLIREDVPLHRDNFILSPFRIGSAGPHQESAFENLNSAADHYFSVLLRNERFASRKRNILRLIKKEKKRAENIVKKLEKDRSAFEDPETFRLYGELILAGMSTAEKKKDFVEVEDFHEPGMRRKVPIQPELSLAMNADAYFKKYRRAMRGLEKIAQRAESLRARGESLHRIEERLIACSSCAELDPIMEEMRSFGMAIGIRDRQKQEIVSDRQTSGIRVYTSSDGLQILVGKSSRDNMKLTFKVASAEDFWLHASDYGGAHVIIKNPTGSRKIPERTLGEAARLAAFFSSGKNETKIEIHYTKKKCVRKGKHLPAGTVLVKRYESIRVRPEHPFPEKSNSLLHSKK